MWWRKIYRVYLATFERHSSCLTLNCDELEWFYCKICLIPRWPSFGSFDVFSSYFDEISGFHIVEDFSTSLAVQTGINSEHKWGWNCRKKFGARSSIKKCGFQRQMCAGALFEVPGALCNLFSKVSAEYSRCAPFRGQCAPKHFLTQPGAHLAIFQHFDGNWVFNPISMREKTHIIFLQFSTFLWRTRHSRRWRRSFGDAIERGLARINSGVWRINRD